MTRFAARIAKAEANVDDAVLWIEAQRLAAGTGERPDLIYQDARRILQRYGHLQVDRPNGKVDIEPMLRAIAEGEGLDYDDLAREARKALRRRRARDARRRKT